MKLDIKIKGYDQAVEVMKQFPQDLNKKMLRKALRQTAKPFLKTARDRAPRNSGTLAKMLRVVGLRRNRSHPSEVAVAIKPVWSIGKKSGKINQYYGLFVHEGTGVRKPRGKKTKVLRFCAKDGTVIFTRTARGMKANPFLEEAYNQNEGSVETNFTMALADEISKFVNKYGKRV